MCRQVKSQNSSLPVTVRVLKTRVLKLPDISSPERPVSTKNRDLWPRSNDIPVLNGFVKLRAAWLGPSIFLLVRTEQLNMMMQSTANYNAAYLRRICKRRGVTADLDPPRSISAGGFGPPKKTFLFPNLF